MEQKVSIERKYHDDGKTIDKEYHVNERGIMHGSYKAFHQNGKIWVDCTYVNGKVNGIYKWRHYNGEMYFIDQNKKSDQHGIYIKFEY